MKRAKYFTLIELLIVITIIGILVTIVVPVVNNVIEQARKLESSTNLSKIGKSLTAYALEVTRGYYPCEVGKDKYGKLKKTSWVKAREDKGRSSYKTVQVIYDSEASVKPEAKNFISPIDGTLAPPDRRANGQLEKFQRDNVGYHYVNGSVSQRVIGAENGLMRDLNEGFEKGRKGHVLLGSGSVTEVEKQGQESSDGLNYRTNWYKNRDSIPNYKNFDNYTKKITGTRPDRVD